MSKETNEKTTKQCRFCRTEIDAKAKVCPNCHKKQRRGAGCLTVLIIAALIIGVLVGIPLLFMHACSKAVQETIDEESKKAEAKSVSANEVIYDESGIKITYTGMEASTLNIGTEIKLKIENSSGNPCNVRIEDFSVDGYSIDAHLYTDVAAGKAANDSIEILDSYLEDNDLSSETIKEAELKFVIVDSKSYDSVTTDPITINLR